MSRKKVTVIDVQTRKQRGEPISMLTAYDYTGALLVDQAEIDVILIGDSLGMVMMGLESTVPVTMEEMLHHCRAVARGAKYAHLVGDLPFCPIKSTRRKPFTMPDVSLRKATSIALSWKAAAKWLERLRRSSTQG